MGRQLFLKFLCKFWSKIYDGLEYISQYDEEYNKNRELAENRVWDKHICKVEFQTNTGQSSLEHNDPVNQLSLW